MAGASGRNQGLLLPGLDPAAHLLFREAVAAYQRLAAGGEVDFDLRPVGHLLLAADEATLAAARDQAGALAARGFVVEELDAAALVEVEPCLAPDLAGGFRSSDGWALDPATATLAWAEDARRAGCQRSGPRAGRDHHGTGREHSGVGVHADHLPALDPEPAPEWTCR